MADIEKLRPKTRQLCKMLILECKKQGIEITVTQTERSMDLQDAYYSQGRDNLEIVNLKRKKVGLPHIKESENKIVTKAKAGTSPHNFSLAFDICPVVNGKLAWDRTDLFKKVGEIGESLEFEGYKLEWGGRFKSMVDLPHFQMKGWKSYV